MRNASSRPQRLDRSGWAHPGRAVTLLAVAALVGLMPACTSSKQGTGTAAAESGATSTAPTTSAPMTSRSPSASASPPAHRTTIAHPVNLRNVRPCKLFTPAVSSAARTDDYDDTPLESDDAKFPDSSGCFQVNGDRNVGMYIGVLRSTDIDDVDESMPPGTDIQRFTVKGYPAVVMAPSVLDVVCFGGVGMADHQMLYLRYGLANPTSTPKVPQTQLCARLRPVAGQLVAELTR